MSFVVPSKSEIKLQLTMRFCSVYMYTYRHTYMHIYMYCAFIEGDIQLSLPKISLH